MVVACNFSILQLARVTGEEIKPPFVINNDTEKEMLKLDIMDTSVHINYSFLKENCISIKTAIQNFLIAVKFNVIPRIEYAVFLWKKGVNQLVRDLAFLKLLILR